MADLETIHDWLAEGRFVEAVRLLEEAPPTGQPLPAGDEPRDARRLAACSLQALRHGERTRAAHFAQRAIAEDPRFAFAHYLRAAALVAQYEAANPGNPLRVKLLSEAGVELDETLHLGLVEAFVYLLQARWAELSEDYRTMATAAKAVLELSPDNPQAWKARARGLAGMGQAATAADELARAAQESAGVALPGLRGWTALHSGRYAEAESLLAEALAQSPADDSLRLHYREAVKARRWWYRPLLAKDLWLERQFPRAQAGWKVAGMIAYLLACPAVMAVGLFVAGASRNPERAPVLFAWVQNWGWLVGVGLLATVLLSAILFASRTVADLVMRGLPPGPVPDEEGPPDTGQPLMLVVVGGMALVIILLSLAGAWLER